MATTLILVHGFMDTAKRMAYLSRHLRDLGWKVLTPSLRPSNGTESIEALAEQLYIYIHENTTCDERISLIGFSMGGLVCRYYLQRLNGLVKTDKLITISTPHQGTFAAYCLPGSGIKQMRPESAFLQNLNADITALQQLVFVSFYSPFDLIIIPARSSVIPFGRNHKVLALLHPLIVYHRSLLNKIVLVLAH
jgi:triacylglycerol lipase